MLTVPLTGVRNYDYFKHPYNNMRRAKQLQKPQSARVKRVEAHNNNTVACFRTCFYYISSLAKLVIQP
jgi:hypothetical protein